MSPLERVEKVLSMPNHRKPPVPERLSTIEELMAKVVIVVREISAELDKIKHGGGPK